MIPTIALVQEAEDVEMGLDAGRLAAIEICCKDFVQD